MAKSVGVCYGLLGDNLPPPSEVVNLYKSNNFGFLRLYAPDRAALDALRGSGIGVLLGTANEDLPRLASSKAAAADWVQTNVRAYWPDVKFRHIAVGNEVIPGESAQYVLGAMWNVYDALGDDLRGVIKVSTSVSMGVMKNTYPPSHGEFSDNSVAYMGPIARFLATTKAPLLLNVYPYFSYIGNPKDISLNYATFASPNAVVTDGSLSYQNIFDAMVDSVYWALEKFGTENVPIVVSETGWPSDGNWAANIDNARTYNSNLVKHVTNGTPKRPGPLETYIFSMFNENLKPGDATERHFGLFYPNKQPVYPLLPTQSVGVCYGMLGDNLPPPSEVVNLYKSNNIGLLRLYAPNQTVFDALRGSGIGVLLGTTNQDLQSFASSKDAAANWVQTNVRAYWPDVKFRHIAVGNEVIPGQFAQYVLPAMQNIYNALGDDLRGQIKVSTSVHMVILGVSYPPSQGAFSQASMTYMGPITRFLADTGAPLLVNVYPYFSYMGNPKDISLKYATFSSPNAVVFDGPLSYQNLFDAMVDSVYSALERAGAANVPIVVSESGWPSAGSWAASLDNAGTYNSNLIGHVKTNGTPKRPGPLETYIFAMFNENKKDGDETERHFGLFYPNKQPVYPLSF